jgi:hypothetical protein
VFGPRVKRDRPECWAGGAARVIVPPQMPTISPRTALDALTKARLLELCGRFEIEIAAARPKAQVVEALAKKSRSVSFEQLLQAMSLAELKKICRRCELDEIAREKQVLIDRIRGVDGSIAEDAGPGYRVSPRAPLPELKDLLTPAPKRGRQRRKSEATRETKDIAASPPGSTEGPSRTSGTKLRLQQFALGVAGGYRAGDAHLRFASDLIRCFGWSSDDELPAEIPATARVVQQGKGVDRQLTALRSSTASGGLTASRSWIGSSTRSRSPMLRWTASCRRATYAHPRKRSRTS